MIKLKKSALILAGLLASLTFLPAVVRAEDSSTSTASSDSSSTNVSDDTTGDLTTQQSERIKNLRLLYKINKDDRIIKYKTNLTDKLDAASEATLKTKCKAAQAVLKSLLARYNGLESNRTAAYDAVDKKLTNIATRLKENNHADLATELEAAQTEFDSKVDAFLAATADYLQTITDAQQLDCESDPTAFKAALESARTARADVADKSKAIRTYVVDTIIPLLKTIKSKVGTTGQEN